LNATKEREGLFKRLTTVLDVSQKKFEINNKPDHNRLKWGRLMVQAINTYGKLLETTQLDQLAEDVKKIKEKVGLT